VLLTTTKKSSSLQDLTDDEDEAQAEFAPEGKFHQVQYIA
jgi:hypothetical protein